MSKPLDYLKLQLVVAIYASVSIVAKLASGESFLSFRFCLFYGLEILFLFVYAIFWQQILKRFPLNVAYLSKATTIIWGIVIGYFVFNEAVSLTNIIGSVIIVAGIILVVSGENR